MNDRFQQIRLLEAILFASAEPMRPQELARFLPEGSEVGPLLEELAQLYANRGVNLIRVGERWAFRSASDLAQLMRIEKPARRKLSRAAVETLAIVAYHQPVTRAEIEEIRGVGLSRGTLDALLEIGWIKPKGRRRTPGRPVTWGTSDGFLDQFGLETLDSLPGQEELKAAGLLDSRPAIASLGARGLLPPSGEAEVEDDESEEEDSVEGESLADLLADDFGEALVSESEQAGDGAEEESEARAEAAGDEDAGDGDAGGDETLAEEAEEPLPEEAAGGQIAATAANGSAEGAAEPTHRAGGNHHDTDDAADEAADEADDESVVEHRSSDQQGDSDDETGPKAMAGLDEHDGPLGRAAAAPGAKDAG